MYVDFFLVILILILFFYYFFYYLSFVGDKELQVHETQIKELQRDIADARRRIEAARKRIPSLDVYASTTRTLRSLEDQLAEEKKLTQTLCTQLETPISDEFNENNIIRFRNLNGCDPEPEQLASRIEILSERLNDKKEQLLERDLIYDEVSNLSDKLRMQASESRGETLELAKKLNELQSKIRLINRQMMASVSELSMYQATAMKLEQDTMEQKKLFEQAKINDINNLPPTEQCEHTWYKMERERIQKQEQLMSNKGTNMNSDTNSNSLMSSTDLSSSFLKTSAQPRPNAYIQEQLGLPRPYGTLAPFKPTQLGTNARHIRVPQPKQIQL
jgi:hypothetical protein